MAGMGDLKTVEAQNQISYFEQIARQLFGGYDPVMSTPVMKDPVYSTIPTGTEVLKNNYLPGSFGNGLPWYVWVLGALAIILLIKR